MKNLARGVLVGLAVLSLLGCARKETPPAPAMAGGAGGPSMGAGGPGAGGPGMGPGGPGMGGIQGSATPSPLVGKKAEDFTLSDVSGKEFSLSKSLADQYVVIYFYKGGW